MKSHPVLSVALLVAAPVLLTSLGCAMCCGPYDYHYPTFGGRIQRADPVYGRVGSIFSDPNMAGAGPLADSNLEAVMPQDRVMTDEPPVSEPDRGDLPGPPGDEPVPMVTPEQTPSDDPSEDVSRLSPPGQWRRGTGRLR
jgi:hypothetical protein